MLRAPPHLFGTCLCLAAASLAACQPGGRVHADSARSDSAKAGAGVAGPRGQPPVYVKVGPGELRLKVQWRTIYKVQGLDREFLYAVISSNYKENGKVQEPTAWHYSVGGKAERLRFTSLDPSLRIEERPDGGATWTFRRGGDVPVRVTLAGADTVLTIHVVELPIARGMTAEQVITALGLPSAKDTKYTRWPKSAWHDGIFYHPSPGQGIIAADHWYFDAYPGAALALIDGRVTGCGSADRGDSLDFALHPERDPEWVEYRKWRDAK